MSDAKSKFSRPKRDETPPVNPNADKWIAEANGPPAPSAPQIENPAHQVVAQSPKPEAMKRLTIDIPVSLHKRVKSQCGAQGTTIADVVRAHLERKFPEPKKQAE
jgi:hypothetical protein